MMHFEHSSWIDAPVERVFDFHELPNAIELLTPPDQHLKIVSKTGGIQAGALVELQIGRWPLSIRWLARHTTYVKPRLFVDEQVKGPFAHWVHAHRFQPEGAGTRLTDDVEFAFPGELLVGWAVKWQLRKMFQYRHQVTKQYFTPSA